MAELENIIESVMSSPESMGKIMDIVKMLGGNENEKVEREAKPPIAFPDAGTKDSGLDPAMISKILGLVEKFNADDDRRIRLLGAIRPYLKAEDSYHIDRAIQIVKLSRVAKSVFKDFLKQGVRDV